jgi:V-type H+-transporting ATPase proteolipid subunit
MNSGYGAFQGFRMLASGLCCGASALASGYAIGVVGEHSVRTNAINEEFYVGMILILIFAEAIGLFGLIIAIILSQG